MNVYPRWKYCFLLILACLGLVYALPNFYGDDPSLQISGSSRAPIAEALPTIKEVLKSHEARFKSLKQTAPQTVLVRFYDTDTELKMKDWVKAALGETYTVAANLAPATPGWLSAFGAKPLKLGLDLRGGIHFLLAVDVHSVLTKRYKDDRRAMARQLRKEHLRYHGMSVTTCAEKRDSHDAFCPMVIHFRDAKTLDKAYDLLHEHFGSYSLTRVKTGSDFTLKVTWLPRAAQTIRQQTIEQTATILRSRINELGVAEAVIQQQGADRIAVDLPGIQDAARAQRILGGTATIELRLVDEKHDARSVIGGVAPLGSHLYRMEGGQPILLKDDVILSGQGITSANANYGQDGRPTVNITVSSQHVGYFSHVTARNIGHRLAILYAETKFQRKKVGDEWKMIPRKVERVISAPVIRDALGMSFEISGLSDPQESANLALTLRAGALVAPISIIESRLVGPSLGAENIQKGLLSLGVGLALVVLFMAVYYRLFGLIANVALIFNLILLLAALALIGAVLTLPGIAGVVLTLGMSVDANVLINERIREELRRGTGCQAAIFAGYSRAFTTIVDANVTTLIVGLALFTIGTGAVKGFAITLTIGLLTSMLTGIVFTRALVNLIYGGREVKRLSIGV